MSESETKSVLPKLRLSRSFSPIYKVNNKKGKRLSFHKHSVELLLGVSLNTKSLQPTFPFLVRFLMSLISQ